MFLSINEGKDSFYKRWFKGTSPFPVFLLRTSYGSAIFVVAAVTEDVNEDGVLGVLGRITVCRLMAVPGCRKKQAGLSDYAVRNSV